MIPGVAWWSTKKPIEVTDASEMESDEEETESEEEMESDEEETYSEDEMESDEEEDETDNEESDDEQADSEEEESDERREYNRIIYQLTHGMKTLRSDPDEEGYCYVEQRIIFL
ncbi:hypothetical protein C9374_010599 [Naegleria lovaniensis]|uniref:Uncharacterized protein n=1 Tax=Naegleria lovaniensis TaxID=51637 RepID=A0AA88GBC0_NAELO|nr:uncharacterized protein C9374_010599 [Naegleria lovaniensis]KAG2374580.1 hypothetical protein C9374_010599 [Naegleria lovaniensis]